MLILTRRPNEAFIIELPTGETIKVAVLSVKPDLVRLGTDAPDDIKIIKEEMVLGLDMERLMLAEKHKKSSD
jgi:carbon storage regulator CsrA